MIIRREEKKDYDEVYDLIKTAFETAKVSNGDEQDYADGLRKTEGYIPELSLVAELDDKLVGQVMFTKTYIVDGEDKYPILLLGPISVLIDYRNKGIGGQLIEIGFRIGRAKGYEGVCLVGDPDYYGRYGFKGIEAFKVENDSEIPDQFVQLYELNEDSLAEVKGKLNIV